MTVAMADDYLWALKELVDTTWHSAQKCFFFIESEVLLGKSTRCWEAVTWVYHLMMNMYSLVAFALKKKANFLGRTSPGFVAYLKKIKDLEQLQTFKYSGVINAATIAELSFVIRKNAQAIHKGNLQDNIGHGMHPEIDCLHQALDPTSGIHWESPITHLIERNQVGLFISESCIHTGGGYSLELNFISYHEWPDGSTITVKFGILYLWSDLVSFLKMVRKK
jgi:hypothetical protein